MQQTTSHQQDGGRALRLRRIGFVSVALATFSALLALMAATLFPTGIDALGALMLLLFAVTLPWTTIGFWNAAIGLALMAFARDPASSVAPHLRSTTGHEKIETSTALLVCVRNEDTRRLAHNLEWMIGGLVATGEAASFHLYILSDSDVPQILNEEERIVDAIR